MTYARAHATAFLLASAALLQAREGMDILVRDGSGTPAGHAMVEVTGKALPSPFEAATYGTGKCQCNQPSGGYLLRISHPAYFTLNRPTQFKTETAPVSDAHFHPVESRIF